MLNNIEQLVIYPKDKKINKIISNNSLNNGVDLIKNREYYNESEDLFIEGETYYDLFLTINNGGLIPPEGEIGYSCGGSYFLSLILEENVKEYQNFSICLVLNEEENQLLQIEKYSIPPSQTPHQIELFINPVLFSSLDEQEFFYGIALIADRQLSPKLDFQLAPSGEGMVQNALLSLNNINSDNSIDMEINALTIETLGIGECKFLINGDIFYIGNDKILEFEEELGVVIKQLHFLDYTLEDGVEENTVQDIPLCLVNYKFDKYEEGEVF